MIEESTPVVVREVGVLEKFEGDPAPENLVQKVYVENGEIIKVEDYESGQLVNTQQVKEVE